MPPDEGIHIDLSGIGAALVQGIIDHVGEIGSAAWNALAAWLYAGLHNLLVVMFDMTLLMVPHALTDRFGPVVALMPDPLVLAAAAVGLSMALLGLKVILQQIPAQTAFVEGVIGRIILYVAVLGALPWLISHAIDIQQQLARSIVRESIEALVPRPADAMDFTQLVALVIMIILGVRLWFKLAANVVHIAAACVWSPIALVCGLLPHTSWVASMWWREFLGRLAGAVLAAIALGLGLALALGYPGLLAIAGGGGAFMAAHDLVDWLARTPGQRMGGVLGVAESGVQAGLAVARGMGGGGAVARAAIPRNELSTRAEQFGF